MDDWSLPKPRLALLLQHFAAIEDGRELWRIAYPLREVLFLAVCATIAKLRRLRRHRRLGRGEPEVPARLFRLPLRHPLRRLASLADEPE